MIVSSFPDLLGLTQRSRTSSDIRAQMETVSQEAVTGLRADITKATDGRNGDLHLLQKAVNDLDLEDRINNLTGTRITLMSNAISNVRESVGNIDTNAIIALNTQSGIAIDNLTSNAKENLSLMFDSLNIRHGTRNLLSGNATERTPFAGPEQLLSDVNAILTSGGTAADIETALDTYFDDPAGGFQTNIYQGGDENAPAIKLNNNLEIDLDVRGDNQAIKDIMRGLSVLALAPNSGIATDSDDFTRIYQSAIQSISNGKTNLIALEADLGIHAESIAAIEAKNQAERMTLTSAVAAITTRDQFEAAGELKSLEVQLQSSYIITSRLSNLSLVNFLR